MFVLHTSNCHKSHSTGQEEEQGGNSGEGGTGHWYRLCILSNMSTPGSCPGGQGRTCHPCIPHLGKNIHCKLGIHTHRWLDTHKQRMDIWPSHRSHYHTYNHTFDKHCQGYQMFHHFYMTGHQRSSLHRKHSIPLMVSPGTHMVAPHKASQYSLHNHSGTHSPGMELWDLQIFHH